MTARAITALSTRDVGQRFARATYFLPALTSTVFFFTKSRTATRPRTTRVSVLVQLSWTSHLVPRTVAELYEPSVRNLPLPSPHRWRFFFFFAAALALPGLLARQLLHQLQRRDRVRALGLAELEDAAVEVGRRRPALLVGRRDDRHAALQRVDDRPDRNLPARAERDEHSRPGQLDLHRPALEQRVDGLPGHRRRELLRRSAAAEPAGGGGTYSNAPMSQAPSRPSAALVGRRGSAGSPASIAGLSAASARVSVGPPLFWSGAEQRVHARLVAGRRSRTSRRRRGRGRPVTA